MIGWGRFDTRLMRDILTTDARLVMTGGEEDVQSVSG
jgi:hypothetical protein